MYGRAILKYFQSGFQNESVLFVPGMDGYGGFFEFWLAFFTKALPKNFRMEGRHLLNALFGLWGVAGVFFSARAIAGKKAGLLAAIAIALTPTYYGHIFMNSKDIPFAVGYIWAIYFFIQLVYALPNPSRKQIIYAALAAGVAMGIRIAGFLLFGYLGLVFLLYLLLFRGEQKFLTSFWHLFRIGAVILLVAYLVMIFFWPFAHQNPFYNPFKALLVASAFGRENIEVFEGRWIFSTKGGFPDYYLWRYYLINLPELILVFFSPALAIFGYQIIQLSRSHRPKRALGFFLILFSLIFPLFFVWLSGSPVYNGNRHFTFVLPSLAVFIGVALAHFLRFVQQKSLLFWRFSLLTLLLYTGFHIFQLIRIHPYEYVYYNSFVGGFSKAAKRYESDYFMTSNRTLVKKFLSYIKNHQQTYPQNRVYKLAFCSDPLTISYYLPKNFQLITARSQAKTADFLFASPRHHNQQLACFPGIQGKEIVRVEKQGVVLGYVLALKPL